MISTADSLLKSNTSISYLMLHFVTVNNGDYFGIMNCLYPWVFSYYVHSEFTASQCWVEAYLPSSWLASSTLKRFENQCRCQRMCLVWMCFKKGNFLFYFNSPFYYIKNNNFFIIELSVKLNMIKNFMRNHVLTPFLLILLCFENCYSLPYFSKSPHFKFFSEFPHFVGM